ncbi:MAG: 2-succinyl-6-hydroxy-2,4-cyclohexadiene-1-carboxylate synthase [Candidatus Zixiibacteriota bacterium]|nr:MAG: 2-succinyl-6-hydroxy-2,4-cyclohexadiene-1-carboxylate synthase [candidate division Zixibacteria bacterium]
MTKSANYHYVTHGDPDKRSLLMLHGFTGSCADWDYIAGALTSSRRCIAVDLPGHGKTAAAKPEDYQMEKCAADLVALLNDLGIGSCDLTGYSMGGRLAFFLAIHYPEKFDKVVIESASPGLAIEGERRDRVKQDHELSDALRNMPIEEFIDQWYRMPLFATMDQTSEAFESMRARRLTNSRDGLSLSLRMMGPGAQPSLWEKLPGIRPKLLLVTGSLDEKYTRMASGIVKLCPAARVVIIDGAGHNVHFEKPEEFVIAVNQFLNP